MMLAIVVVLIWLLSRPKTMVTMIVAGSSVSQHVPKEKRLLRPSSYMAGEIHSDDEERMVLGLNSPALSEGMTGALKSDAKLEATMSKADQNSNGWSDLQKGIELFGQLESESDIKAASVKLKEWMDENKTDQDLLEKLKSVKIDKESAKVFMLLNWAMNNPDKFLKLSASNSRSVPEFFEKPLVKIYIKTQPQNLYRNIFIAALDQFGDSVLETQLLAMLDSGFAPEATGFVLMNLLRWRNFTAEDVFYLLKPHETGINKMDNLRWNLWISYTILTNKGHEIYASQLVSTMLKNNFDAKNLDNWNRFIQNNFPKFVTALKRAVEKKNAALPPNKRRRVDNGT